MRPTRCSRTSPVRRRCRKRNTTTRRSSPRPGVPRKRANGSTACCARKRPCRTTSVAANVPGSAALPRCASGCRSMGEAADVRPTSGRLRRVARNLRQGMALAWAASPRSLVQYSLLGVLSAAMPPVSVYLGATLVNRIAAARSHAITLRDLVPVLVGLWVVTAVQRAIGAYMGYGRNLFVRRVQLEAERRLLAKASTVDLGHFDNSDWHDRLSRAKRDVSWRPGDLTWSVLGLSGNIATLLLMASLLASLSAVLVVLALASAVIALLIEGRVTLRMYEFFYRETPDEREREYIADLLVQP